MAASANWRDEDWEGAIRDLERESVRAFLEKDVPYLDAIFSDTFIVNSPMNRIHDKRKVLDLLSKGVIAHAYLESQPELIRREGDIVVVMGADTYRNVPDAPLTNRRFTNIWRKEEGRWRLIVRHANITPDVSAAYPAQP